LNKQNLNDVIHQLNDSFNELTVEELIGLLTNYSVKKFDPTDCECIQLKKNILDVANDFISEIQAKGGQEFDSEPESNLRTQVSAWFQREIEERIRIRTNLEIKSLGWAGYPRFEIKSGYLQIKVMRSTTGNTPRSLYISQKGLKVSKTGYHLGLLFIYDLESNEDIPYVYPTKVKLIDLSQIKLTTKIEFSAPSSRLKKAEIVT